MYFGVIVLNNQRWVNNFNRKHSLNDDHESNHRSPLLYHRYLQILLTRNYAKAPRIGMRAKDNIALLWIYRRSWRTDIISQTDGKVLLLSLPLHKASARSYYDSFCRLMCIQLYANIISFEFTFLVISVCDLDMENERINSTSELVGLTFSAYCTCRKCYFSRIRPLNC